MRHRDWHAKISRRRLLRQVAAAAPAAGMIFGAGDLFGAGRATEPTEPTVRNTKKFLLYIHLGSPCGLAAGLLQPRDAGRWQRGLFVPGQQVDSVNPLMNKHFKYKNLVFHDYVKFLERIGDHMCFAAGPSRTVSHEIGLVLQSTGDTGDGPNPSWPAGFAQAMLGKDETAALVAYGNYEGLMKLSSDTPSVAVIGGHDIASFRKNFEDEDSPRGPNAGRYWGALAQLYRQRLGPAALDAQTQKSAETYLKNLASGLPDLAADSQVVKSVLADVSVAKVAALVDTVEDKEKVYADTKRGAGSILTMLQLAAVLAATGRAKGMSIAGAGVDTHYGSTSALGARIGSHTFAEIAVFWEWIKARGLQDDVMVIVSQEFTRTPYDPTTASSETVVVGGQPATFQDPGTGHGTSMGMVFINGKVPPASRIGGLHDNYVVFGSKGLDGIADPTVAPWDSAQLVGTMLQRCFGDVFWRERVVRDFWRNYKTDDLLSDLLLT